MPTFLLAFALSSVAVSGQDLTHFPSLTGTPGQPAALAVWPKDAANKPAGCWKNTPIRSNASGWPGQCLGLTQYVPTTEIAADVTLEMCKTQCVANVKCSVWQFSTESGCYSGTGTNCMDRGGDTPLTLTGAERLKRGEVRVLKNMNGTWVFGLRPLGEFASGTAEDNSGRCRDWCYSNLDCQYWQYGQGGCWAEDRASNFAAQYPLKLTETIATTGAMSSTVEGDTNPARTLIAGEYIQHYCPEPPTTPPPAADKNNTMLYAGLAALGLLLAVCALFLCCGSKGKKGTRAVKKTRAVKAAPKAAAPIEPESVPLVPLMMPASVPMMQYAPAPQMQFASAPTYQPLPQFHQPMQQFQTYMQ